MAKVSKKSLLLVAVALSALFAFMLYRYLNTPVSSETVIVATSNITPKTTITADMVKEVAVPKEYIQPNAMTDKKKVVGSIARESIISGEQITARRLVVAGKSIGFTGIIPKDKRAMTVAVTEETGVACFPKPGDFVDVVVTFDQRELGEPVSQIVLQNLQVLATNHEVENGEGQVSNTAAKASSSTTSKTNTVTLAVSPLEAAQLALSDEKGKVRLALRPFLAFDSLVTTTAVTPTSVIGNKAVVAVPAYKTSPAVQDDYPYYEASYDYSPAQAAQPASKTIQVIRGTKVESLSLN
ncbi:MAG: Flp pilus assembly protein CpaB [Acholeplasmataceae bacterium]|nr:Flp pilus assembly protein CpaB [Acholeplasmataceae bacterium]